MIRLFKSSSSNCPSFFLDPHVVVCNRTLVVYLSCCLSILSVAGRLVALSGRRATHPAILRPAAHNRWTSSGGAANTVFTAPWVKSRLGGPVVCVSCFSMGSVPTDPPEIRLPRHSYPFTFRTPQNCVALVWARAHAKPHQSGTCESRMICQREWRRQPVSPFQSQFIFETTRLFQHITISTQCVALNRLSTSKITNEIWHCQFNDRFAIWAEFDTFSARNSFG